MMYCTREGCDSLTDVISTRGALRRRRCKTCNHAFYTEEVECRKPKAPSPFGRRVRKEDCYVRT
jgi:NAD-dependent SIR2 family protein deacetylase